MLGVDIRRDDVLRILRELEAETLEKARNLAAAQQLPTGTGGFEHWVHKMEERLEVLEALRALMAERRAGEVLRRGDQG